MKQIDSMLLWVCKVIDHWRCHNVARTSVTHSTPREPHFLSLPHLAIICDLLLKDAWQCGINALDCTAC